ncbi:DNA glycosylase [Sparassis latifolia]
MPVTRAQSGATSRKVAAAATPELVPVVAKAPTKRKALAAAAPKTPSKKTRTSKAEFAAAPASAPVVLSPPPAIGDAPVFVPAVLTFSFEDAKQHLIAADRRFADVFARLKCRPFEHLERVDPFSTLADSILGQQISWRAARSIRHRFIRLFDPSLPEKPVEHEHITWFPSAHQVISMDVVTLKSAGLSTRKAEYVLDLAARFADGRLSTEKLLEADDEELARILIEVRGIGRWTVDMFALFSLRRPDILPIGDLGVQRGVLRWFLSLHSPSYSVTLAANKLPKNPEEDEQETDGPEKVDPSANGNTETLPSTTGASRALSPDASSVLPAPALPQTPVRNGKGKAKASEGDDSDDSATVLPPPFTPSINKTLHSLNANGEPPSPPLPEGLTPAVMKSRLDGKKKIKGALLTPKEMEELTECWRPYRSVGVYYMWALAESPK